MKFQKRKKKFVDFIDKARLILNINDRRLKFQETRYVPREFEKSGLNIFIYFFFGWHIPLTYKFFKKQDEAEYFTLVYILFYWQYKVTGELEQLSPVINHDTKLHLCVSISQH